jgi:hypothetical protein
MGQDITAQELMALARRLRDAASATGDYRYIELFLRTASPLEERAAELAFGPSPVAAAMGAPVNFRAPAPGTRN